MTKPKNWRPPDWEHDKLQLAMKLTKGGGSVCDPMETIERAADLILDSRRELDKTIHATLCEFRNNMPKVPHERSIDVCINQLKDILGWPYKEEPK